MRKLKIGITCYPTVGGSGVIATELGKMLAEKGHEIHFITIWRIWIVCHIRFDIIRCRFYTLFKLLLQFSKVHFVVLCAGYSGGENDSNDIDYYSFHPVEYSNSAVIVWLLLCEWLCR